MATYDQLTQSRGSAKLDPEIAAQIAAINAKESQVPTRPTVQGGLAIPQNYGGTLPPEVAAEIAKKNEEEKNQDVPMVRPGTLYIPKVPLPDGFDHMGGYTTANGTKLQDIPDFAKHATVEAAYMGDPILNQNYNYSLQNRFANSNAWDSLSNNLMSARPNGSNALRANQSARQGLGQMQRQDFSRFGNQIGETMKNEFGNVDTINNANRFNTNQYNIANKQTVTNRMHALDAQRRAELENWSRINADLAGLNLADVYERAERDRKDDEGLFGIF